MKWSDDPLQRYGHLNFSKMTAAEMVLLWQCAVSLLQHDAVTLVVAHSNRKPVQNSAMQKFYRFPPILVEKYIVECDVSWRFCLIKLRFDSVITTSGNLAAVLDF